MNALSKFPYFVVCNTYSETLACLLKCNCQQLYFHVGMGTLSPSSLLLVSNTKLSKRQYCFTRVDLALVVHMNSYNNRPKWALSPFEPIYCMSFGCPFEIASAGIKEGRQSCYKTTCLVDYSYMFFCISSVRQTAISQLL